MEGFRHDLTLELFAQRGAGWNRIAAIRRQQGIQAIKGIPPKLLNAGIYLPRPIAASDDHDRYVRWLLALNDLHDAIVPPECRVEGRTCTSAEFWRVFLSACVLFDPPGARPDVLKKRSLTTLYNERPTWLAMLHADLDRTVWVAYGWEDDEAGAVAEEAILPRLLSLNLARAGAR